MNTVQTAQELKGLQTQLSKARAEESTLKTEAAALQRKHTQARQAVQSLEKRIEELSRTAPEPTVSEHALLRYLERVKGVDLEALRQEILDNGTADAIAFAGNGRIKKGGTDITLIVQNSVVVTVKGPAK